MSIQNYLLCILYALLLIGHSYTLSHKDFYRGLISIFSFALITQTVSTILLTLHQTVVTYGQQLIDLTDINPGPIYNVHYFAQLIHKTSINFFILFLLIVAKGWPITRRDMPFKYTFAVFWIMCLAADLITFYWSTITLIAKNFTNIYIDNNLNNYSNDIITTTAIPSILSNNTIVGVFNNESKAILNTTTSFTSLGKLTNNDSIDSNTSDNNDNSTSTLEKNFKTSLIDSLPNDTEQLNSTPRRLSLLLRIVIMLYFLLELRTTMILEQEQKKLQFYLHFGALSMVWFVHSLIVYVISLRVEIVWQAKLISGFSSAANFLAFAVTTRILWPKSSRSYLFRKSIGDNNNHRNPYHSNRVSLHKHDDIKEEEYEFERGLGANNNFEEYEGLEMRDLSLNR